MSIGEGCFSFARRQVAGYSEKAFQTNPLPLIGSGVMTGQETMINSRATRYMRTKRRSHVLSIMLLLTFGERFAFM